MNTMNVKHFTLMLVYILFYTVTYGQKINYAEGQLQEWKGSSDMQLKTPYYRVPKLPRDIGRFADIKSQLIKIVDWPKWENINGDFNDDYFLGYDSNDKLIINKKKPHFEMFDDKLEISNVNSTKKLVIWFAELKGQNLRVIKLRKYKNTEEHSVLALKNMWFEYNVDWLADYLYAIQYFLYEKPQIDRTKDSIRVADNIQFSIQAAKYRTMPEKPIITEEQRKYIVQANAMNEKKEYGKAIELYNKALEINPVAYPGAYYNLALLCAQTKEFQQAIYNMKKYLLLVPNAPDARAAQDKIYEWEAELKN